MRHSLYILYIAAIALLAGCSNIAQDDRLVEIPVVVPETGRGVLIEDFTGQNCPNCPNAAAVIEGLEKLYEEAGANVVAVSIHSGPLADRSRRGLFTAFGQYCFDLLGNPGLPQPAVRVNRVGEPLVGNAVGNTLPSLVASALAQTTPVTISDFTATPSEEGKYSLSFNVSSTEAAEAQVQVWAIENHIIASQSMPDGHKNDSYEHMAVLRSTITPNEGVSASFIPATTLKQEMEFTPSAGWVTENLEIVVIVSQPGGEVLQVKKFPLATEEK